MLMRPMQHTCWSHCRDIGLLGALVALVACSESPTGSGREEPLPESAALVSAPVIPALGSAPSGGGIAWVSMPPGTDSAGASVTVRHVRGGSLVSAPMVDGGFDPIALAAQPGDTLLITVVHPDADTAAGYTVVPIKSRPVVVRTSPPNRKTDVPLNIVLKVVFNEPMDGASLPGAVHLKLGGATVPGTLTLPPGGGPILSASFTPASPLTPATAYQLEVSTAARDLGGDPLTAPVQVTFTTGARTEAVSVVIIYPSPFLIAVGGQQPMVASPLDSAWATIAAPCSWSSNDATVASISTGGLLSARTAGTALIQATCGGVSATDTVTVSDVGVVRLVPSPVQLTVGRLQKLFATLLDGAGTTLPGSCAWSASDASVAAVSALGPDSQVAALSALTPGTTLIQATCGGVSAFDTVTVTPGATNLVFATVGPGQEHACGLTTAGAAYCWGPGYIGLLGDGRDAYSYRSNEYWALRPQAVSGGPIFAALSVGRYFACGLMTGGSAWCWGSNDFGQLGGGPGPDHASAPRAVGGGHTFKAVSGGYVHACGLTTAGVAYCWGWDTHGEIGTGTLPDSETACDHSWSTPVCSAPQAVAGGLTFASLSAGLYATCGVTTGGAAYCWGSNLSGQLGIGTTTGPQLCTAPPQRHSESCSWAPVAVGGGLTFAQVSVGFDHTCGLTTAGAAYCWGMGYGPAPVAIPGGRTFAVVRAGIGDGGLTSTGAAYSFDGSSAVAVAGGLTFADLNASSSGGNFCGVTTTGVAYCWGRNGDGQLGDGTQTDSPVPVKVAGQP